MQPICCQLNGILMNQGKTLNTMFNLKHTNISSNNITLPKTVKCLGVFIDNPSETNSTHRLSYHQTFPSHLSLWKLYTNKRNLQEKILRILYTFEPREHCKPLSTDFKI